MKKVAYGAAVAAAMMSAYAGAALACEGADCSPSASDDIVMQVVESRLGELGFQKGSFTLRKLPEFDGLYEVVNKQGMVFITDVNARYFIAGHVIDPVARKDLSLARINAGKIGKLKEAAESGKLFVTGDKRSRAAVVIFDDPDCPFCARLEAQLDRSSGVKAYHVMSPLTQLHPQARDHATMVLCSYNQGRKLKEIMAKHSAGAPVSVRITDSCRRRADKLWPLHDALVKLYGVNGTPLLVRLKDGDVWQGYMPIDYLKRWASGENLNPMEVNAAFQRGM